MWRCALLGAVAWSMLAALAAGFEARAAGRWHDLVEIAIAGPDAWSVAAAWGLRTRFLAPAGDRRQRAADGCGPAALHAFLASHRPRPTQDLLWSLCRAPQGGATLGRLGAIARRFGCACRVDWTREPESLPLPAIVHLRRGHFVLLVAHDGPAARVLDPACGWVRVPWPVLRAASSGAVLARCNREAHA